MNKIFALLDFMGWLDPRNIKFSLSCLNVLLILVTGFVKINDEFVIDRL